ncbi:uncharacterized protein LODBEIA_P53390 [Lodderomyces beijingensis]|uniref:Oxidant-induced cell-cycle arrest protein 5 n=1 Tax=Lodderomyces beijingensis TaxID=1775926 RepID=A0ABP0ZWD6_9ASCO
MGSETLTEQRPPNRPVELARSKSSTLSYSALIEYSENWMDDSFQLEKSQVLLDEPELIVEDDDGDIQPRHNTQDDKREPVNIANLELADSQYTCDELLMNITSPTREVVTNEKRRILWPKLLLAGHAADKLEKPGSLLSTPSVASHANFSPDSFLENLDCVDLPPHKDEDQVKLDIQRSFTMLSHIQSISASTNASPSASVNVSASAGASFNGGAGVSASASASASASVTSSCALSSTEMLEKGCSSFTTIISPSDIKFLKKILSNLIIKVLRRYPSLNYYQGYHDIASIVLLVCYDSKHAELTEEDIDQDLAFSILEKLTVFHLRDFMISEISLSVNHLRLIPAILENADRQLFELIKQTSNSFLMSSGKRYDYIFLQGLSSILTLFSHDLSNLSHILTAWDFILSYGSVFSNVYIYSAALLVFKSQIWEKLSLSSQAEEADFENVDPDAVHAAISPAALFDGINDKQWNLVLIKAKALIEQQQPWAKKMENSKWTWDKWFVEHNPHSVLLTTSAIDAPKNESFFAKYSNLLDPDNHALSELVQAQDDEVTKQTLDEIQEQQAFFAEEDELNGSMDSSEYEYHSDTETSNINSLSSSLTLNTSSSLYKITSAGAIFKNLFSRNHDDEEKKLVIRNKNWFMSRNFYKFSIAVGVIGFVIHFLLIKNGSGQFFYRQMLASSAVTEIKNVIGDVGVILGNLISTPQTHSPNVLQVGTGTLRNTLYGIGS